MNSRVVTWAFVAILTVSSVSADKGLDKPKGLDGTLSNIEQVPDTLPNPSAPPTLPNPSALPTLPNPSAPPIFANPSAPPTLPAEMPCLGKLLCKDKCATHKEKHCLTVPVPKKHCTMVPTTLTKEHCEKKCSPLAPPVPDMAHPNPSAPPADTLETPLNDSHKLLNKHDQSEKHGSRRLHAAAHKEEDSPEETAPEVTKDKEVKEQKKPIKIVKAKVQMHCQNVCVQVPYIIPNMECVETTEFVEKCTETPEKVCQKDCMCLAEKLKKEKYSKKHD